MKKIIASAGLAVIGAASLQAAYAPDLTPMEKSKPWTLSGLLRGFYDDNYATANKNSPTGVRHSFGVEISPSLAVNLALDQTLIGFSYTYDMRYYEDRAKNGADHSHKVDLSVNHAFNERYKLQVSDTFLYAQEPDLAEGVVPLTLRTDQDYWHNKARGEFDAQLTPVVGLGVSYQNDIWDYQQGGFPGSLSGLLDRVEHLGSISGRWQALPTTVGILQYSYQAIDYTSGDLLITGLSPETRDANSHIITVGAEHSFNSQLKGNVSVGAQFTDYRHAVAGQKDSATSPYADASVTWAYNPGSYLRVGVLHKRNPTDVAQAQDQESTGFYGEINHRITPRLTGSLTGRFQHSTYNGGGSGIDGKADEWGSLGINFSYQVNTFLSTDVGYNYDRLDSDLGGRSYTRNQAYVGIRATY